MNLSTRFSLYFLSAAFWAFFCQNAPLQAQCPQASFTLPDTVCIGEAVNIVNTSTGATRYEWDFCSGDLEQVPVVGTVAAIPSIRNFALGITTAKDGENWHSFVTDYGNNAIVRLDYGTDLNNTPAVVNLGNPGGLLTLPDQMKIIKEGNTWFGLVGDLNSSSVNRRTIVRLNFGDKLTNAPQASYVQNLQDKLEIPRSLEIFEDKGNYIAVVANHRSNRLAIINFGNSVANEPQANEVLLTNAFQQVPSGQGLMRVSIMKYCNQWIGAAVSFNNKIFLLEFGENLFSIPKVTPVDEASPFAPFLTSIKLLTEQSKITAVVTQYDTKLVSFDFGRSVLNRPVIKQLFDFGATEIGGPDIVSDRSVTFLLAVRYTEKQVTKVVYPSCDASQGTNNLASPAPFLYTESGMKKVTLTAYSIDNAPGYFTDSVFVRPSLSAAFTAANACLGQPVTFTAPADPVGNRAVSYTWDFGNGNTASGRLVQQAFAAAGTYNVSLTIRDVCGKTVTSTQAVQINPAPVADFVVPTGACSNQTLSFSATSNTSQNPIVAWEWNFGDGSTATGPNATHAFAQAGNRTVKLTVTGQSGCRIETTKVLNLQEGANVALSVAQTCLGGPTRFRDETQGSGLTGRTWDFGDNSATSAEANPGHTYAQPGTYLVKLTVQNSTGCAVTRTQSVTIRRPPQAAFTAALACSGESTQFTDGSTGNDGSIARWQWSFGDAASGASNTSDEANPRHVFGSPGTYQVKLKVTTGFGCADSVTRTITVTAAPRAVFSFQANCTGTEVAFADASQPPANDNITAWYWDFGDNGTPSTERSPRHRYAQAGTYKVRLTVTSANRCTNTAEQTVTAGGLSLRIVPDTAVCAGVATAFSAQVGASEQVTWQWDFGPLGRFSTAQPTVTVPANQASLSVTVTATTASGCSATLTRTLPVRQSPTAQFVYEASAANPLAVAFNNRSLNASHYVWDFGESGATSSAANPTHTYAQPGLYEVSLRAVQANGCASVTTQTVLISLAGSDRLAVIPNPHIAEQPDDVRLVFRLARQQDVLLEIYDPTGRRLTQTTLQNTREGVNTVQLADVLQTPLAKGLYVVVMRADDIRQTCKMVVQ